MKTPWRGDMYLLALSNNLVPDTDTSHFTYAFGVGDNALLWTKFTAKYGDGSTALLIEDD